MPAYTNIFGDDHSTPTTIDGVDERGIIMQSGLLVPSPVILLNGQIFLWDVPPLVGIDMRWTGWAEEAFKVFEVVTPKPEMIVVGSGKQMVPLAPHLRSHLANLGFQLEVQDTRRAAAAYNMFSEEGRSVAAALLPLTPVNARTGQPTSPS